MWVLLAAAVYVEVLPPPGPYLFDRVRTPSPSFDDAGMGMVDNSAARVETLSCMETKCGTNMEACLSSRTCASRLNVVWHKVKVAQMTEVETDLMACMLHESCLIPATEGFHGTVHRVSDGAGQFAWRQPVGFMEQGDIDTASSGAATATALRCPGVVPVIDAHPEVKLHSGEVVRNGFIMPLMDGTLFQWLERQSAVSSRACLDAVALQAGGAVACLHARGYTHGDVHGDNFLYQAVPGGCPRLGLVDFENLRPPALAEGPATGPAGTADWERFALLLHRLEHPEASSFVPLQAPPTYPLTTALLAAAKQDRAEQVMRDFILQHEARDI